jgi:hypothetical protein
MNSMHDTVVYCREPRGPGVELGSPQGSGAVEAAPLVLRLLASLQRRFNSRRLLLRSDAWQRNAPAVSIRGAAVSAALLSIAVWACRDTQSVRVAPIGRPDGDAECQLWADVFAAVEDALSLPRGTICFRTSGDSLTERVT